MVQCNVETRADGKKYVLTKDPISKKLSSYWFQIVSTHNGLYKIILPDDYAGWVIGKFHIEYEGVAAGFIGKKFWDVTDQFIVGDQKSTISS